MLDLDGTLRLLVEDVRSPLNTESVSKNETAPDYGKRAMSCVE